MDLAVWDLLPQRCSIFARTLFACQ